MTCRHTKHGETRRQAILMLIPFENVTYLINLSGMKFV